MKGFRRKVTTKISADRLQDIKRFEQIKDKIDRGIEVNISDRMFYRNAKYYGSVRIKGVNLKKQCERIEKLHSERVKKI